MKALTLFHNKVKVKVMGYILIKFIAFPANGAVFTIVLNTSSSFRLRCVRKAALRLDKLALKKSPSSSFYGNPLNNVFGPQKNILACRRF